MDKMSGNELRFGFGRNWEQFIKKYYNEDELKSQDNIS